MNKRKERIPVVCLGAGGHASVVVDMLRDNEDYELVGLLDSDSTLHGKEMHGVAVLGSDKELLSLQESGVNHFISGLGAVKSCQSRKKLYQSAVALNLQAITVIHPTAIVSKSAVIKAGSVLMPRVVVNANAYVGENVILNTGVIVEHDSVVGDHSHIATGACLAGGVTVGDAVLIGANATIRENLIIEDSAVVGAGSVVLKNVKKGKIFVGNPAKERLH